MNFGLNVINKKKPVAFPLRKTHQNPLLDDDQDIQPSANTDHKAVVNAQLRNLNSNNTQPELEYDYDKLYDEQKRIELYNKRKRDGDERKPKYMENLIAASQKRKIELERAKVRKLHAQRELEDSVYGETEEFVTEAYLEAQKQAKLLEEEQAKIDALEQDPNRKRDVVGFYKSLIKVREGTSSSDLKIDQKELERIEAEEEKARLLESERLASAKNVMLNASNEIVDKRQLLSGGLNLSSKALARKQTQQSSGISDRNDSSVISDRNDSSMQPNLVGMKYVKQQAVEVQRKQEAEMKKTQEMITKTLSSKITSDALLSAKERYLARKRK